MKKQTIDRRLVLSKKTVSNLDDRSMRAVRGGDIFTDSPTCISDIPQCHTCEDCSCVGVHCA